MKDFRIVESWNFLDSAVIVSKWKQFNKLIECPDCGDMDGHAGTMDDSDHSAYCVKCGVKVYLKNARVTLEEDGERKRVLVRHMPWEIAEKKIPINKLHDVYSKLSLSLFDDDPKKIADKLGDARKIPKDFSLFLVKQGYRMYNNVLANKEFFLLGDQVPSIIPCFFRDDMRWVWKPLNVREGILIPVKKYGKIVGYEIRNLTKSTTMSKYLKLSTIEKENKYNPACCYLEDNLDQFDKESNVSPLYIVEGMTKAQAVSFYLKKRVIGVSGTTNYTHDEVRAIVLNNRQRPIIIVPDQDYKENRAVARSTYKLIQWLSELDLNVMIQEWTHPVAATNRLLKGIDDALIWHHSKDKLSFNTISKREFLTKMSRKFRHDLLQGELKSGAVVGKAILDKYDLVVRDDRSVIAKPDLTYEPEDRLEVWGNLLAKHKFIVDVSPTGMGKSHTVGTLSIEDLNRHYFDTHIKGSGPYNKSQQTPLFPDPALEKEKELNKKELAKLKEEFSVRRVQYICQSPLNLTVGTLLDEEKWALRKGRTASGWTYDDKLNKYRPALLGEMIANNLVQNCPQADDINTLRQNRQVITIKDDICKKCPLFKSNSCAYFNELSEANKSKYLKLSLQSLSYKKGDVLVIDDFGSVQPFIQVNIDLEDIDRLLSIMEIRRDWINELSKVRVLLKDIIKQAAYGLKGRQIYEKMKENGELDKFPISQWLRKEEPDKIPTQVFKIDPNDGGIVAGDSRYLEFKKIKRWFFLLLKVFEGSSAGDFFYDSMKDVLMIKGVDPKFEDMLNTVSGILILDATASKDFLHTIFGAEPYVVSSNADPLANVKVTVVEGLGSTYKSGLHRKESWIPKIEWINQQVKEHGEKSGIITFKSLLEGENEGLLDESITKGYWFFSDRASNLYYEEGCKKIYLLGIPIANVGSTEMELSGKVGLDQKAASVFVARPYGETDPSTNQPSSYIVGKESDHPALRQHAWYKRASAYLQAVGRLRSVRRTDEDTLEIIIMDPGPLPFKIDEIKKVEGPVSGDLETTTINLAKSELSRKLNYLSSMKELMISVKEEFGNALSYNSLTALGKRGYSPEFLSRYANAKQLGNCTSIDDLIKVLDNRIEELKNPTTKDQNLSTILPKDIGGRYIGKPELTIIELPSGLTLDPRLGGDPNLIEEEP